MLLVYFCNALCTLSHKIDIDLCQGDASVTTHTDKTGWSQMNVTVGGSVKD